MLKTFAIGDKEVKFAHINEEQGLINIRCATSGDLLAVTHSINVQSRCRDIYRDFMNDNIKSKEEVPGSFNWSTHRCLAVQNATDIYFEVTYTPGMEKNQREKLARQLDKLSTSNTQWKDKDAEKEYVPIYETFLNRNGEDYYWISANSVRDQSQTEDLLKHLNKIHPGSNFTEEDIVSNKPFVRGNKSKFTSEESSTIVYAMNEMMKRLGYTSLRKKIKAA